jgi:ABC-type uncharacterized transport system auxiliary subunit
VQRGADPIVRTLAEPPEELDLKEIDRIHVGVPLRQLPMLLQVFWIDVMFTLFTEKKQRAFEMLSRTRTVLAPGQAFR